MAKFRVQSIEERADGDVKADTWVLVEKDDGQGGIVEVSIGHFDVIFKAAAVLAAAELPKPQRIEVYKKLFAADPRIAGVTDSEAAVSQMEADVEFPVTVTI